MKYFFLSLIIVLAIALAAFGILSMFGVSEEAAVQLAGAPFTALPFIYQKMRLYLSKMSSIVEFKEYSIPAYVMVVYSALILIAVSELCGFFAGLLGSPAGIDAVMTMAVGLYVVLGAVTAFHLGRWIGSRSRDYSFVAFLVAGTLGIILTLTLNFLLVPDELFTSLTSESKSIKLFAREVAFSAVVVFGPGIFGWWRGRNLRFASYLSYLLQTVPPDTRDVLVNMAHEEATRLARSA